MSCAYSVPMVRAESDGNAPVRVAGIIYVACAMRTIP